jgi:SAM-dependent methyltransferase
MREVVKRAVRAVEPVIWGGQVRERLLVALLTQHYASLMRRQWSDPDRTPHFFDHRIGAFGFATGKGTPFGYYRGYYAAEVMRSADRVLDIGCGDGFFARRFFSPRCAAVDAVDIEPSAIAHALQYNGASNVTYTVLDAVTEQFPSERYDVIVWDGGLGHVTADAAHRVFAKIKDALAPDGIFVGSESLGYEGHDHLQFFSAEEDLCALFEPHFSIVLLRRLDYQLRGLTRQEAFWRSGSSRVRIDEAAWTSCAAQVMP